MKKTLFAAALLALAEVAVAQAAYPVRPVTLVVPVPARRRHRHRRPHRRAEARRKWGQTVVVENKGGAAGMIGADLVAKAKPDGYTLLMGNIGTQAINPACTRSCRTTPTKAFAPITLVAELPLAMMVNPHGAGEDGARVHRAGEERSPAS